MRTVFQGKVERPMLLHRGTTSDLDRTRYHAERKWDGTRVYLYKNKSNIHIVVCRGKHYDYTFKYPELVHDARKLKARSCILDGELVWFDKRGNDIFYSIAVGPELVKSMKLKFMAFDILNYNGNDVRDAPIEQRKALLYHVIPDNLTIIKETKMHKGNKKEFYKKVIKKGGEGVVLKASQSLYQSGERKDTWIKVKKSKEIDCLVLGSKPGTGSRAPYFGALQCYYPIRGKMVHIGDVGSGFNEDDLIEITSLLKKNKPFVVQISYMEMSPSHHMRFPVFERLRKDKKPSEVGK